MKMFLRFWLGVWGVVLCAVGQPVEELFRQWDEEWTMNSSAEEVTSRYVVRLLAAKDLETGRRDALIAQAVRRARACGPVDDLARLLAKHPAQVGPNLEAGDLAVLERRASLPVNSDERLKLDRAWVIPFNVDRFSAARDELVALGPVWAAAAKGEPAAFHDLSVLHAGGHGLRMRMRGASFWAEEARRAGFDGAFLAKEPAGAEALAFYEKLAARGSLIGEWGVVRIRLAQAADDATAAPWVAEMRRLAGSHTGALLALVAAQVEGRHGLGDLDEAETALARSPLGEVWELPKALEAIDQARRKRSGLPDLRVPGDHATLQAALDAAQPGQFVVLTRSVPAGTHVMRTPVHLRGAAGMAVALQGPMEGPALRVEGVRGFTVRNLEIHNATPEVEREVRPQLGFGEGSKQALVELSGSRGNFLGVRLLAHHQDGLRLEKSEATWARGHIYADYIAARLQDGESVLALAGLTVATPSLQAVSLAPGARLGLRATRLEPANNDVVWVRVRSGGVAGQVETDRAELSAAVYVEGADTRPVMPHPLVTPGVVAAWAGGAGLPESDTSVAKAWAARVEEEVARQVAEREKAEAIPVVASALMRDDFFAERTGRLFPRERRLAANAGEALAARLREVPTGDPARLLADWAPALREAYARLAGTGYAVLLVDSGWLGRPELTGHVAWAKATRDFLLPGDARFLERLERMRRVADEAARTSGLAIASPPYHWKRYAVAGGYRAEFPCPPTLGGSGLRAFAVYDGATFDLYRRDGTALAPGAGPTEQAWATDRAHALAEAGRFMTRKDTTMLEQPRWVRATANTSFVMMAFRETEQEPEKEPVTRAYRFLRSVHYDQLVAPPRREAWECYVGRVGETPPDAEVARAFFGSVMPGNFPGRYEIPVSP